MSDAPALRARAEDLSDRLPPLLVGARHLASTVILGAHGRRQAGQGTEFWQYRPAMPGDELRLIDWRRSARSDTHYLRQKEWQAAQSVELWVDRSASMGFASTDALPTKADRAALLALALALLLERGGERIGLLAPHLPPRHGQVQMLRIADLLVQGGEAQDYGAPETGHLHPRGRAVFFSDFLGPTEALHTALDEATARGVTGALVQILDPQEEAFPFRGRTIFDSMGGTLRHETLKAADLRDRYLSRLAERKAEIRDAARRAGWQVHLHHTDQPAQSALLWLFGALERVS
ncbi:DUF58 domain-containing protein [Palleronia caenipelagi]|uniref:DUF58 domain-containing protein n=1 Tax=Palleronia caenipelagi TaxID=2489174 RepID=A0A547Q2I8_9RHOB|nr:DUF58 domain-containing protein [Palleronia caenipelagi]TRD20595.1 DUF58 domain-containing protein [Palleronia caenipelagi]